MTRIAELVDDMPEVALHGTEQLEISGLGLDSRHIRPGELFAALEGATGNGRAFVGEAVGRGAVAILSAPPRPEGCSRDTTWIESNRPRRTLARIAKRFHRAPDESITLIGVTGTDGKTSTTHATAAALESSGQAAAVCGTLGRVIAGDTEPTPLTTPEAPDGYAFLRDAVDQNVAFAVLEVSSAALVAERVHGMRFAGAILTGLGRDHLDLHGTADAYRAAKRLLFESLSPDAFAVIPDSAELSDFRSACRGPVTTFGAGARADWRISESAVTPSGMTFRLVGPGLDRRVALDRPSPWETYHLTAATAAASSLGLDPGAALDRALLRGALPGRWECIDAGQGFIAVVDYAHTPEALETALRALRQVRETGGRVIVVFGCGGDRDRGKRREMGRVAGRLADLIVVTDDNPRSEDPEAIAEAILEGITEVGADALRHPDRAHAIAEAVELATPGDALLIAGKGHETYQELATGRVPFDDRHVLTAALAAPRGRR